MRKKVFEKRFFSALAIVALGLGGCGGESDGDASFVYRVSQNAVSGGGATVGVVVTNSWPAGFNGAVRITNNASAAAIVSFEVIFQLSGDALIPGAGWNGSISGPDASGTHTAISPDWLQYNPIQAGNTWEVGFTATGTFAGAKVLGVKINGEAITFSGSEDVTAPVVSLCASTIQVATAGSITLTATASDTLGVANIEIYEGSTLLGTASSSPCTVTITMSSGHNGTHVYTAMAYDAAGNSATSETVTVTASISNGGAQ